MDDMHDMICLAELPELAGDQDQPKSRITLMKRGRYRHPKFGLWNITADTFEGFLRNFREGAGRVPIDVDHGPEKGGSTEAAGWVTSLEVVGDQLVGDVEWTKIGAEAIREKRYLFVSPTWSFNARTETGQQVGPKLIGAGLTNRNFFPLPALNLASWPGELWTPNEPWIRPASSDCPCPACADLPDAEFDRHWAEVALPHGVVPGHPTHRGLYHHHYHRNAELVGDERGELKIAEAGRAMQRKYWNGLYPQQVAVADLEGSELAAEFAASPVAFAMPAGLDKDGEVLFADVAAFAEEHGVEEFDAAFAGLVRGHGTPQEAIDAIWPRDSVHEAGSARAQRDQEDRATIAALDLQARILAGREQIAYADAGGLLDLDVDIAEQAAVDGYSETPWLDTSRSCAPRPWVDDDYQRDVRRAAAVNPSWELSHDEWRAAAEAGQDVAYERAVQVRSAQIAELTGKRAGELQRAKEREAGRRREAIEQELRSRARKRLGRE